MRPARGRVLAACTLALVAAATTRALPVVRKTPGGPWVTQTGPDFSVPAGQTIEWSIRLCSGPAEPITAQVSDYLHSGECPGHEVQELLCPPLTVGDGTVGACDDGATPAITNPALEITALAIDVNQCVDIVFATRVDLLASPGTQACNVAVYATSSVDPNGSGQTTPPSGSGCTCVTITPPLPTQMSLELRTIVDDPPFSAGDAQSTVVFDVTGANQTPRDAEGRFVLPIPVGLELTEWLQCPPGATCSVTPAGEAEIAGLVVPEGGSFAAAFRLRGTCAGVSESRICAQGWFEPVEEPAARLLTDDPDGPGSTPTCFKPALPDLVVTKTWRLEDLDASGGPTAGDRVRFLISAWNRGVAPAREAWLRDTLPIGYDHASSSVTVDSGGRYILPGTAQWDFPEIGPGSVAEAWLETTMLVDAVAPNRAQLSTRVIRDCGIGTVLSDDPLTAVPNDATAVGRAGRAAPSVEKSFTFTDSDRDGWPTAGETIRYRIVMRNHGSASTGAASLVDDLPACLADASAVTILPSGAATNVSTARRISLSDVGGADGLAPDEEVAVEFTSRILDPATCCNQATLTWPGGSVVSSDPRSLAPPEPTCLIPVPRAVTFTKRATLVDQTGDGLPTPGDRIRFDLVVSNEGAEIPDLMVTDEIPAGLVLDPASVTIGAPTRPPWDFAPAPAGLHGAGRLQVSPISLAYRTIATISFETDVAASASGEICNVAGLVASNMTVPRLSEDAAAGGPTCLTVVAALPPELAVELLPGGPLTEDCALAGEEMLLTLRVSVSGGTARDVTAAVDGLAGLVVLDDAGGVPGPGEVGFAFGNVAPGSVLTRILRVQAPCADPAVPAASARAAASNAPSVVAPLATWPVESPDVTPSLRIAHDDTNADGVLDPGETVLATVTVAEGGSCDAADVAVSLALDPDLAVVELRDGAVLGAGTIDWTVASLPLGTSRDVTVVLGLDPAAPDCAEASVTPSATWPSSPGLCLEMASSLGSAETLPDGPCAPSGSDLLREQRVSDLADATNRLSVLLDPAGDADSCLPGAVTRVDPSQSVAVDVSALLVTGIVLPGDAVPVGPGVEGQLVLYEVSRSCDVIHACKVDADGDPSDPAESVRIGVRPCN